MYLNVGKNSALVEVNYEYNLVVLLKELYKVSTNVSSIFFDGYVQALITDAIFHNI